MERFEAAADAIVGGKIAVLERLLREDPELVRARSTRQHQVTLLHYVAANGVEQYRQRTPKNIVRSAEILLAAGAAIDATAELYGGGATTLGLAATSVWPERAGVQEELMKLLLDHGADDRRYGAGLSLERAGEGRGVSGRSRGTADARNRGGRGPAGRGQELFR